ncbi:MAG: ABC transporter ATP-binding protein [Acidobacteriota bacterium]
MGTADDALVLDRLSVGGPGEDSCREISLRVPAGTVYALLGRGEAGSALLSCVAGKRKPSSGRALLLGEDAWRKRRRLRGLVALAAPDGRTAPEELWDRAMAGPPRLLLLDGHAAGSRPFARPLSSRIREAAARGAAILLATGDAADAESVADRVGILRGGALALDEDVSTLTRRFRRLRYRNEITETRTEYGTELDLFEAVRVRVRGYGVEAIVSNFDEELFERLRSADGVADAEASLLTIAEIFGALAPGGSPRG